MSTKSRITLPNLESVRILKLSSRRIVGATSGHDPQSAYVERFWLPVLGPSTTWLIRLLNMHLERDGEGIEIALAEIGRALGLGDRPGRHAPLLRALRRAADYDLVMLGTHSGDGAVSGELVPRDTLELLVRRRVPGLSTRLVERLDPALAREHFRCATTGTVRVLHGRSLEGSLPLSARATEDHPTHLGKLTLIEERRTGV